MRRLTDDELADLCRTARAGAQGPREALDALWALILYEAHGADVVANPASVPPGWVQDYSIQSDQAAALFAAMVERRRLPKSIVSGFHLLWLDYSPSEYEAADPMPTG